MKNLTKKRIEHGKQLVRTFGYWSEEVRLYLEKFEYNTRMKLERTLRNPKNINRMKTLNELPEKSYFYQMQVYMHLTGKKKGSDKVKR